MKKTVLMIMVLMILLISSCANSGVNSEDTSYEHTESEDIVENDQLVETYFDDEEEASNTNKRYILTEIRIRSEASTSSKIVGHVQEGETYEVLDTKKDEKYTWYKIGDDKWIADDGTWTSDLYLIKFKSNNGSKKETYQEYGLNSDYHSAYGTDLQRNSFIFDGHVFCGWNTKPDGSGEYYYENTYPGNICKGNTVICLYAQWVPVSDNRKFRILDDAFIIDGPSFDSDKSYAILRKDDYLESLETADYKGKTWIRVATDSWIIYDESSMEELDDSFVFQNNISALNFTLPKKIKEVWMTKNGKNVDPNNYSITFTFVYNSDGSLSYVTNDYPNKEYGYKDDYAYMPYGIPSFYAYGDNVDNEYDVNGRIKRQIFGNGGSSKRGNEYSYDSEGRIKSRSFIQNFNDRSLDIGHNYFYDSYGRLVRIENIWNATGKIMNTDYFDYNGNFVVQYSEEGSYSYDDYRVVRSRVNGIYRYDELGRIVEYRWDYGIGASDYDDLYTY